MPLGGAAGDSPDLARHRGQAEPWRPWDAAAAGPGVARCGAVVAGGV